MAVKNHYLKLFLKDQTILYALSSPITTLGTASEVTITLPKSSSDERHCRIERREDYSFIIRDLRSSSGTFVNDTRIVEAILKCGDKIKINDLIIEFTNDSVTKNINFENFFKSKNIKWKQQLESFPSIARTPYSVLILGPSGSGKELSALAIHENSHRASGPFITVNCSALAENLIESEFFGHSKGSFTGAINDRKGAFESARGGTLFLDEIGDLPYNLQSKLLRALENHEIRPVGSDRVIKTDVRIIAATHHNLHFKMLNKNFRSDLYYRLNVITVQTPSLLERMEDFEDIIFTMAREHRIRFSYGAIQKLKSHRWPGNIRELKNVVSRAAAFYSGGTIDENIIEELINSDKSAIDYTFTLDKPAFGKTNVIKELEKQMILQRLLLNKGNQRKTAQDLGMPKSTLHDRIKSYKIDMLRIQKEHEENT